jgi:anti-anti-sigma factor
MKRHLTLTRMSQHLRGQDDAAEAVVDRAHAAGSDGIVVQTLPRRPRLTLADPPVWRHTLILTGKLDTHSTTELEDEIECLCQEGVTTLTLDLRQLEEIDSVGIQVVAFRSALCKRRGHEVTVIPGSRVIHRALAEAGASDLLMPGSNESIARHFFNRTSEGAYSDRSTTMVKAL